MISEGSCDTEDWSNDAENSDFYFFQKLKKRILQPLNFWMVYAQSCSFVLFVVLKLCFKSMFIILWFILELLGLVYVLVIFNEEFQWIPVETMHKKNAYGTKLRVTVTS